MIRGSEDPLKREKEGMVFLLAGTAGGHVAVLDRTSLLPLCSVKVRVIMMCIDDDHIASLCVLTQAHDGAVIFMKCSPKFDRVITSSHGVCVCVCVCVCVSWSYHHCYTHR